MPDKFSQGPIEQVPGKEPLAREAFDMPGLPLATSGIAQFDAVIALARTAGAGVDNPAGGNRRDPSRDGGVQFDLDDQHGCAARYRSM